jgi:hypothetical protein
MYGGAVGPAAELLGALPYMGDIHGKALGHPLAATPLTVTVVTVFFLLPIALWLWMARAVRQGRNWARILSAVLLGLQTLWLLVIGPTYAELFFDLLSWLTGLEAVWLLWRPASSAFFKSARAARSRPPSQISGP